MCSVANPNEIVCLTNFRVFASGFGSLMLHPSVSWFLEDLLFSVCKFGSCEFGLVLVKFTSSKPTNSKLLAISSNVFVWLMVCWSGQNLLSMLIIKHRRLVLTVQSIVTASDKVDHLLVVFITLLLSEIIQAVVYICTAFIISHGEGLTCTYTSLMMTGGSLPLLK